MSDTPSISIGTVTGGQNNIGKTEIAGDQNQTNNFGCELPEVDAVVAKIEESIPEADAALVAPEIRTLAAMPIAQQQTPEIQSRILAIANQIRPHAGTVWKNLAVFGATALETLAMRNPVIAGIVQVCKANSQPTE